MYLSHFRLREKPFATSADPKFLWLGEKHKQALGTFEEAIMHGDGYIVVTGDVGTGKTTLSGAILNELRDQIAIAIVAYPDVETLDFFRLILTSCGIGEPVQSKTAFLARFERFLLDSIASGRTPVLVIDEAQRLTPVNVNELLHLSNLEANGKRLLHLVFAGQNEFNAMLKEESYRALRERVGVHVHLGPLTMEQTRDYMLHRLKIAQCETTLFTPEATREVFRFSGGIPRLINVICDLALLLAYLEGGQIVSAEHVKRSLDRLRLPGENTDPVRIKRDSARVSGKRTASLRKPGFLNRKKRNMIAAVCLLLAGLSGFLLSGRQNGTGQEGGGGAIEREPFIPKGRGVIVPGGPSAPGQDRPARDKSFRNDIEPWGKPSHPDPRTAAKIPPGPGPKDPLKEKPANRPEELKQGDTIDIPLTASEAALTSEPQSSSDPTWP